MQLECIFYQTYYLNKKRRHKIPEFKYRRTDRRVFLDELKRTIDNLKGNSPADTAELKAMTIMLFYSGARVSEVIQLKPNHIRENKDSIEATFVSLKREKKRKQCPFCKRKSVAKNWKVSEGKYKCTTCKEKFNEPLIHIKKVEPETRTLTFAKDLPYFDLFYNHYLSRKGYEFMWIIDRQLYQHYLKKANPNLSAHAFRHSLGRVLDETGAPIFHIKEILGHKSISTTTRYVTGSKKQTEDIQKMGEWAKKQNG